jgi:hypothetical protein
MTPDKAEKAMGKPNGFFIGDFIMSGILKTLKNEFTPCNPFFMGVRGALFFKFSGVQRDKKTIKKGR